MRKRRLDTRPRPRGTAVSGPAYARSRRTCASSYAMTLAVYSPSACSGISSSQHIHTPILTSVKPLPAAVSAPSSASRPVSTQIRAARALHIHTQRVGVSQPACAAPVRIPSTSTLCHSPSATNAAVAVSWTQLKAVAPLLRLAVCAPPHHILRAVVSAPNRSSKSCRSVALNYRVFAHDPSPLHSFIHTLLAMPSPTHSTLTRSPHLPSPAHTFRLLHAQRITQQHRSLAPSENTGRLGVDYVPCVRANVLRRYRNPFPARPHLAYSALEVSTRQLHRTSLPAASAALDPRLWDSAAAHRMTPPHPRHRPTQGTRLFIGALFHELTTERAQQTHARAARAAPLAPINTAPLVKQAPTKVVGICLGHRSNRTRTASGALTSALSDEHKHKRMGRMTEPQTQGTHRSHVCAAWGVLGLRRRRDDEANFFVPGAEICGMRFGPDRAESGAS
ncbi:hypothetical protein HYPSUDRAFT_201397 [Hypholoma sublateritium FD-334 SS-4]|uniref:Uncharacterized protein n=1 Tax=Hypholoma sublateritium (strain FD-334 SS-4) TaxID=945553 RepID=A0A0D2MI85_HYPSF|nr:hypothetical protein HYPSUDRAFT_201397 [Hypholoma sublateritium FD-334 SS-4]